MAVSFVEEIYSFAMMTPHFELNNGTLWIPTMMQRSLMTGEERDMIDLEVTSFMTACAAGVDALKALLQKERLRRMEQEATVRVNTAEGDDGQRGGGALGIELRPGSRPTHEHAAVTFLFERLRAVTEVAETMQVNMTSPECDYPS